MRRDHRNKEVDIEHFDDNIDDDLLREKLRDNFGIDLSDEDYRSLQASMKKITPEYIKKIEKMFHDSILDLARVDRLYSYEYEVAKQNIRLITGVDEAGRGALAGPLVVAAVILPLGAFIPRLNDSKKLSPRVREEVYSEIFEQAIDVQTAIIDEGEIDNINVYHATIEGMYEALKRLKPAPEYALIDAIELPKLQIPSQAIIKGDEVSASIAAASVVAKVTRDRIMTTYDEIYPEYGFKYHKGYGTAEHLDALEEHGFCPLHRKTFAPIKYMVRNEGF